MPTPDSWSRVVLEGERILLEPLDASHAPGLLAVAQGDRSTFTYTTAPHDEASTSAYIARAMQEWESGDGLAFATIDKLEGRVVGSTRFARAEYWAWPERSMHTASGVDAIEIGWTWLAPSAQRTGINREAKRLMLDYAFGTLDVRRVTLKTDARNERSRRAIEGIGGKLDGVLRAHMPAADGGTRDSAVYSILRAEWPQRTSG